METAALLIVLKPPRNFGIQGPLNFNRGQVTVGSVFHEVTVQQILSCHREINIAVDPPSNIWHPVKRCRQSHARSDRYWCNPQI